MHLIVAAEAELLRLKRWENELSGKRIPYPYEPARVTDETTGQKPSVKLGMLQISVRPIQFYDIVFPKAGLNDVLAMIQPYGYGISEKIINLARKAIKISGTKLLPIPKIPPMPAQETILNINGKLMANPYLLDNSFVNVMGIGLKEDKDIEFPPIEDL